MRWDMNQMWCSLCMCDFHLHLCYHLASPHSSCDPIIFSRCGFHLVLTSVSICLLWPLIIRSVNILIYVNQCVLYMTSVSWLDVPEEYFTLFSSTYSWYWVVVKMYLFSRGSCYCLDAYTCWLYIKSYMNNSRNYRRKLCIQLCYFNYAIT